MTAVPGSPYHEHRSPVHRSRLIEGRGARSAIASHHGRRLHNQVKLTLYLVGGVLRWHGVYGYLKTRG